MRARAWIVGTATAAAAVLSPQLPAQTATVSGTVTRDSAGHGLAGAEIMLPGLSRAATANYAGEFKLTKIPAGRHVIVVRHVGYAARYDTLDVAEGARVDREFILAEQVTQLGEVTVTAPGEKYTPPGLREFEERRKLGFGRFIPEEEMRKNNERRLIDVIVGYVPGVSLFTMKGAGSIASSYIASSRKCGTGPSIESCKGGYKPCPVSLFIDGAIVYNPAFDGVNVPDLSRYNTRDYAAVEYYAGGASMPAKYNMTSSGCGVLLLWTRAR